MIYENNVKNEDIINLENYFDSLITLIKNAGKIIIEIDLMEIGKI